MIYNIQHQIDANWSNMNKGISQYRALMDDIDICDVLVKDQGIDHNRSFYIILILTFIHCRSMSYLSETVI